MWTPRSNALEEWEGLWCLWVREIRTLTPQGRRTTVRSMPIPAVHPVFELERYAGAVEEPEWIMEFREREELLCAQLNDLHERLDRQEALFQRLIDLLSA